MTDATVEGWVSRCHHAPLIAEEIEATDDHPAGRLGRCAECGLSCWLVLFDDDLGTLGGVSEDGEGVLAVFNETFEPLAERA